MKLSAVKDQLEAQGILDSRRLMTYATLSGTVGGGEFQNIVAVCFQRDRLRLYRCKLDNTVGELLTVCPYSEITDYVSRNRFLYSYTEFSCGQDRFRLFDYDKKALAQGFSDAGIG